MSTTQETKTDNIDGLAEDMDSLCTNGDYSDVEFLVEDERLPGHRMILAKRSEYFRAMFYGGLSESKEEKIRLEVPLEAFKTILKYLYSGKLPLSTLDVDKIYDVLGLAHLYGLEYVVTTTREYLKQKRDISNVWVMLDAARRYNLDDLTIDCLSFIDHNALDILKHDSFKMLSKPLIEKVLRRDTFWAREVDIFRSLCRWRDQNPGEDIQTLVESLVRLPLISVEDLVNVVHPTGIVEPDKIFEAIKVGITGKNLPHRAVLIPGENVASEKYRVGTTVNGKEHVIQLNQSFLINYIYLDMKQNLDRIIFEYSVDVSCDQILWDRVGKGKIKVITDLTFTESTVRYIRITLSHKVPFSLNVVAEYIE